MAHQNTPTTNPIPLAQARRGRGVGGPSRGQDRQVVPTRGLGTSSTSRIARPSRNNQVAPSQGSFFTGANDLDINGGQFNMTRGHHTNLTINFNQGGCVDIDEAELGGDEERRQANNVSVRTPEQAIRVPDEQRQPWRRPSLPVQKSCDIYYRHLSVKGRGSPLWVPEPNTELPLEYQRRGISIGDVGIITDYGGFDFLFNICLPPGHPINPEDLPENFAPLNPPLRPIDVRGHSGFRPGSYLSSGSVERSRDDSDPFGLTFETTESEGAILTMPQGSKSRDLGSVVRFRKYMSANAEDWYRYVHDVRGREARNGDVRLVVGWDQTTTWGMATFTKTAAQNGIRLKFGPMGESSVGRTYGWQYAGMAEVRAGPDIREIEELRANDPSQDDIVYRNQCLFIRTLNATLDNDVWDKLVSETDMTYVQNDPSTFDSYAPSSFHPTNPSGSTTDRSTSNPGGQSGARGASRMADTVSPISTQSVHVSDLPTALAAHPSKVINEMLLKERPNAKMAITEDNDWISVISQNDLVLPPADQLFARILRSHHVCEEEGVVFLDAKQKIEVVAETVEGSLQSRRTSDDEDVSQEIVMALPVPSTLQDSRPMTKPRAHLPIATSVFVDWKGEEGGSRKASPAFSQEIVMALPVPSTPQDSRPLTKPRAHLPIATSVFVNWKGEEDGSRKASPASLTPSWQGNRLGKDMTKSTDNLKLSSVSSSSSSRRNQPTLQLPMTVSRPGANMRDLSDSPSSTLALSGMPKSYEPLRGFIRPLSVQGSLHGTSPDVLQGSSSRYNNSRGGGYSSILMSSNQDPYPPPQSAARDTISPTRAYPRMQSLTVPSSTLGWEEFNRSPRTVPHSPGLIPGPRPKPTHYSDLSDFSSDVQSWPETENTTPPRTPVSPQSLQHEDTVLYLEDPSPPLSPENPTNLISKDRSSELTVKQENEKYSIFQATSTGTFVHPQSQQSRPARRLPSPPPLASRTSWVLYGPDGDDDDDPDNRGGVWIARRELAKNAARPSLKVQIENLTGSSNRGSGTTADSQAQARAESPPKDLPPPSYRLAPTTLRLQPGRPESTSIDPEGDNWALRPPPENIYDHLEEFFPKHDLDKPVIEATSGNTSPTTAEASTAALPPPTSVNDDLARIRAKKSIRIVVQEHKKRIDRISRAAYMISHTDNVLHRRRTKLWGSKWEEVTTVQGRNNSNVSLPEAPSGGPRAFQWVRGELIGKGTYGRVYLALNATTGEIIAVKQVQLPQTASDENDSRQHTVVQAVKMESETLRDLDHPNIVQYLGFEETAANLSIFLEYVPGGSVGSCLHKHGKFDDNVTRSFTAQILCGLEYLHSKGILHRDLKGDNILVEMSGTCKISDFSVSKRTEDLAGGASTPLQGTLFWMAPEVINTQEKVYNFKIDIWSVGCVVLEMWSGMRPWIGEEMVAVMFKLSQSKEPPPVPEDIVLSEEADDFRRRCFAINPEERPSAAELRQHPYLILPPDWAFSGFT